MNKKTINILRLILFLIFWFIVIIIYRYTIRTQNEERYSNLEKYGTYTIGKVEEYFAMTYGPGHNHSSIRFSYKVLGSDYLEDSEYKVPDKNGPMKGSLFMAIYLPNNPENCILLLDYPVKDSSDYKKYIEQFKSNPPKLN